jgi:hypothetical protein
MRWRNVNRKNLTPQAKKLLSYLKDTRNTYGESRSRSRFAIAKRKAYGHQALRHEQKLIIKEVIKVTDEEIEIIEAKMKSVEPKKWRKYADSPLGEFVSILLKNREIRGINKEIKSSSILEKAELKTRRKNQWHYRRWHKNW